MQNGRWGTSRPGRTANGAGFSADTGVNHRATRIRGTDRPGARMGPSSSLTRYRVRRRSEQRTRFLTLRRPIRSLGGVRFFVCFGEPPLPPQRAGVETVAEGARRRRRTSLPQATAHAGVVTAACWPTRSNESNTTACYSCDRVRYAPERSLALRLPKRARLTAGALPGGQIDAACKRLTGGVHERPRWGVSRSLGAAPRWCGVAVW